MTYCCGILVRQGLVMIADTRTNAGLDNISTFRKLQLFEKPGKHVLMLAASGNLSVTQGAVNLLVEGLEDADSGMVERLEDAQSMVQAAHLVGRAVRRSLALMGEAVKELSVSFEVALLFGGQIGAAPPRLFMIYTAGNAIECTPDTPYSASRRAQIRQAHSGSRHHLRHRYIRRAEDRAHLDGLRRFARTSRSACP